MKREYYISQLLKADTNIPMANAAIEDANRTAKNVINKIYDDFDSRVCVNCKYSDYRPDGGNTDAMEMFCNVHKSIFTLDFGCNEFERKQ